MYDNSQWDSCKIRSLCEGSKSRSRRERRRRDSRSVSRRRRRWLTPGFTYRSWRLGHDEAKSNAASIKKRDRGWWRRSGAFLRSNSEFGLALWSKIVSWRCLAFAGKQEVRKHYFGDVYQAGPALHLPSGQNSVLCAAFLVPSSGKYKPLHPELFENQRENLKRLALCFETNHDNAMISTLRRWLAPSFLRAATAEHPDFKDALLLVWIGVPHDTHATTELLFFEILSRSCEKKRLGYFLSRCSTWSFSDEGIRWFDMLAFAWCFHLSAGCVSQMARFCNLLLEEIDHAQQTAREAGFLGVSRLVESWQ